MQWPWRRRHTFDSPPKPIDQLIFEMLHGGSSPAVGRTEALSVPAVQRGRNLVCSIATLPLEQHAPDNAVVPSPLLGQLDPDVPNVVTLSQTLEDLLLDSVSWWLITAQDFAGFPISVRHLDVGQVSVQPPGGQPQPSPLPSGLDPRAAVVYVDGKAVDAARVIRFDSPNPGVLKVGGRAIRRAILLDQAANMYADDPRPLDYFTPADGADPVDDDESAEILAKWKAARKARATAFIPAALMYHSVDAPSPAELQLVELQRQASLDIANALGVDPEDLGISTTSRTYSNDVDRRRNKLNEVLAPFLRAIEHRLSMGDVTRRGYVVRFNTTEYLLPNPTERWGVYQTAKGMGVMTDDEIRQAEGMPPLPADAEPEDEATTVAPVEADRRASMTFDGAETFELDLPIAEFSVDRENRVIEGLTLPYDRVGMKGGARFRFQRGALQWSDVPRIKLVFPSHGEAIGKATQLKDTPTGLLARFKVGRGAEGDRALELAEDGVYDGLSVGVDFDVASDTVPDPKDRTVLLVRRADLRHVALTSEPVFDDARVTRVAASRTQGDTEVSDTPTSTTVEVSETPTPEPVVTQTFSAETVGQLLAAMVPGATLAAPQPPAEPGRQVVDPTRTLALAVTEPPSYTFDRDGNLRPGSHDFSSDLIAGVRDHDQAAYDRALGFVQAQFDVVTSNVATLNPNVQRPDLYVDQREFRYPVWDAVNKGTLSDKTPFVFPKFSTATGLVAAHVEGTEPTSGAFTATSQTVTPTAISGKAKISREVFDAGGSPQVSGLIWRQMVRGWFESLEAAAVAELDAATPTSLATFTVGGGTNKQTLIAELEAALSALQFVRGGFSMTDLFCQIDLYLALVAAKDTTLRPYFPVIGPMNTRGTTTARFGLIDINGVTGIPTWALAATGIVPASSYLFDRESVHGWASAPQRIDITMTEVANVYLGIFGYKATAISDINGVREVIYDPA